MTFVRLLPLSHVARVEVSRSVVQPAPFSPVTGPVATQVKAQAAPVLVPYDGGLDLGCKSAADKNTAAARSAVGAATDKATALAVGGAARGLRTLAAAKKMAPRSVLDRVSRLARRTEAASANLKDGAGVEVRAVYEAAVQTHLPAIQDKVAAAANTAPDLAADLKKALRRLDDAAARIKPEAPLAASAMTASTASVDGAKYLDRGLKALERHGMRSEPQAERLRSGRTAQALRILPDDTTRLGAFIGRLEAKYGTEVWFSPQRLREAKANGAYAESSNRIYIDLDSLLSASPSPTALHEARHAHYANKRANGTPSLFHTKLTGRYSMYRMSKASDEYHSYMSIEELSTHAKGLRHKLPKSNDGTRFPSKFVTSVKTNVKLSSQTADVVDAAIDRIDRVLAAKTPKSFREALQSQHLIPEKRLSSFGADGFVLQTKMARVDVAMVSADDQRDSKALAAAREDLSKANVFTKLLAGNTFKALDRAHSVAFRKVLRQVKRQLEATSEHAKSQANSMGALSERLSSHAALRGTIDRLKQVNDEPGRNAVLSAARDIGGLDITALESNVANGPAFLRAAVAADKASFVAAHRLAHATADHAALSSQRADAAFAA